MSLQIKELHIRVTMNADKEQGEPEETSATPEASGVQSMNKGEIIAECVEQVMEILKEKMEP